MKYKNIIYISLIFALVGCNGNNESVLNPSSPHYRQAYFSYNGTQMFLESVNGRPYKQNIFKNEGAYIPVGKNMIQVMLKNSKRVHTLCFIAKPAQTVYVTYWPLKKSKNVKPVWDFNLYTSNNVLSRSPDVVDVEVPC